MTRFYTLISATMVGLLGALSATAEVAVKDVNSPGGIKAWLVEEHSIPFTALELRFRGGTSLDAPGKRGATYLMSGLLEEGSGDLNAQAYARELESLSHKLGVAGRVRFLGWRTDMADLMATADMLVCPSRIEPLGNVVIEAWARNLPVVAAAADGPAWLIEDGTDGLLAPVEDSDLLGEAINRVATDPGLPPRLVAAGRKKFEADFTESAVVAQFLDLFERVRG